LCRALGKTRFINSDACNECVYNQYLGCIENGFVKSYNAITSAESPEQLLYAYRKRARVLNTYLNKLLKEGSDN
jgi:hypothetical protein